MRMHVLTLASMFLASWKCEAPVLGDFRRPACLESICTTALEFEWMSARLPAGWQIRPWSDRSEILFVLAGRGGRGPEGIARFQDLDELVFLRVRTMRDGEFSGKPVALASTTNVAWERLVSSFGSTGQVANDLWGAGRVFEYYRASAAGAGPSIGVHVGAPAQYHASVQQALGCLMLTATSCP